MLTTFDDIFKAFGGTSRIAEAIGVDPSHAQTMKSRRSIPPAYWPKLVAAAAAMGDSEITFEKLAELAAAKRAPPPLPPTEDAA